MRTVQVLAIFIMAGASVLLNARQAEGVALGVSKGQSGVVLENVGASVRFGEQITFIATIRASIPVQNVTIIIFDEAQGITHTQPIAIKEDGTTEYVFDTNQNILRPFTTVRWSYQIMLTDGSTVQSETYLIRYDDDRFAWQTLEAGALRVHWYNGDANFGRSALNTAQSGLQSIGMLLSPDLAQSIDIYIYANEDDLRGTLYLEEAEWVAGHANAAGSVVMTLIEPGASQSIIMEQRIPHELMHIMLYRRVGAGYGNIPAWLREGAATLAEVNPNPDYDRALAASAADNSLIAISNLCASFPTDARQAFLAYAQSRSFVSHLRDVYGAEKLIHLALSYADGQDCERGVEGVYGISLPKLESDWRASRLGQNPIGFALAGMTPYLVLLCLVLFIPFVIGFNTLWRKKK